MATWGERNNNPGCIKGRHYDTLEEGYAALNGLLVRRYSNQTAFGIFKKYAPYSDGNNPRKYADFVVKRLRERGVRDKNGNLVTNSTRFDFSDPVVRAEFTMAISKMETGKVLGGEKTAVACANSYQQKQLSGWKRPYSLAQQPKQTTHEIARNGLNAKREIAGSTLSANTEKIVSTLDNHTQSVAYTGNMNPSWWKRNMPSWLGGMSRSEMNAWREQETMNASVLAMENTLNETNLTDKEQQAVSQLVQQKIGLNTRLGMLGQPVVLTHLELKEAGLSNQDINQFRDALNNNREMS